MPYRIVIAGALVLASSLGCSISPEISVPRSASHETEAIDGADPGDPDGGQGRPLGVLLDPSPSFADEPSSIVFA